MPILLDAIVLTAKRHVMASRAEQVAFSESRLLVNEQFFSQDGINSPEDCSCTRSDGGNEERH